MIKFESGRYFLYKVVDGVRVDYCGDIGGCLLSLDPKTGESIGQNGEVIVGARIQCGSLYARSYQQQDWWMTSVCTEILESHEHWALIKTKNSVYVVGDANKENSQLFIKRIL